MNAPFFKIPRIVRAPRIPKKTPALVAVWTVEPRTGRPVQSWRQADAQEGSCTARPSGPRPHLTRSDGELRLAA